MGLTWIADTFVWIWTLFCRPVRPGAGLSLSATSKAPRYGTFGCVVRHNGRRHILSCAHIFDGAQVGHSVRLFDVPRNRAARILGSLSHLSNRGPQPLDYSLATVMFRARVKGSFPRGVGRVSQTPFPLTGLPDSVPAHQLSGRVEVQAVGATTGHTFGGASLGAFSAFYETRPARPKTGGGSKKVQTWELARPLIEIKPSFRPDNDFCRPGDSGALVLTVGSNGESARPLGLLVAAREGPTGDFGLAIPIQRLLEHLGNSTQIDTR